VRLRWIPPRPRPPSYGSQTTAVAIARKRRTRANQEYLGRTLAKLERIHRRSRSRQDALHETAGPAVMARRLWTPSRLRFRFARFANPERLHRLGNPSRSRGIQSVWGRENVASADLAQTESSGRKVVHFNLEPIHQQSNRLFEKIRYSTY